MIALLRCAAPELVFCRLARPAWRVNYGERAGTRTRDPMIKSHVLYRLSYALAPKEAV